MSVAIAVSLLFLLQMTFLPAIMVLGGYRERQRMNSCLCCVQAPESKNLDKRPVTRMTFSVMSMSNVSTPYIDLWNICAARLAILLHKNWFRILLALFMIGYWTTSLLGCTKLTLGLTPEKFFLPTSILNRYFRLDNGGLHQALTIYVFVSRAPNFMNAVETRKFLQLAETFENLPFSMGNQTTMLFYRPYAKYLSDFLDFDPIGPEFYDNLPFYLSSSSGSRWLPYLPGYNGTRDAAKSWSSRSEFTNIWRSIADNYSEFNVSLWDDEDENYISDQLDSIPGNTVQDVGITAACMGLVCILFIPNIFNTLCAMLTILSINLGVFGYLVFWGVSLDPISMATLLMSIGFSVDFTSHISFHYYTSKGGDKLAKMYEALSSIGYPMLQSGASTILSVSCLCFVPSYMVLVFFKTVFLVVVLGVFHGLIVLPTFLAWLPENCCHQPAEIMIGEKNDNDKEKSPPDIVRDIKTIA
uniref:Uncharacterized protein n=1 Tax=Romanomermis culicivorax TaxID=13658 RepID=A0A915IPE5_ROMCU